VAGCARARRRVRPLLTYPQPLFAFELRHARIVLHADRPVPEAMQATLERVRARLDRSTIVDPERIQHVFVCQSRPNRASMCDAT
jgi:hypothetical protein